MPGYSYRRLDPDKSEVRLLTLQPGTWNQHVECTLKTVSLDDSPQYEALSYVWGDASITREIVLDDHSFEITWNLFYALRRLRYETQPRIVWADAICINQTDDVEKSAQVAMMSRVFSGCKHAVLWLGEDPDLAEATNHLTPPVSGTAHRAFELLSIMATDNHLDEKPCFEFEDDGSIAVHEDFMDHVRDLEICASLPWWTRVWVLQESALPPSVTFTWASATCTFEDFDASLKTWTTHVRSCCDQHWVNLDVRCQNIYLAVWTRLGKVSKARHCMKLIKNNTLPMLYQDFIGTQATQAKDLVYGLFGMVTEWASARPLAIDYTLTDAASLARSFVYCIRQDKVLHMLLSCRRRKGRFPGPTWFPDVIWDPQQDFNLINFQVAKWDLQNLSNCSSRCCNEAQIIHDSTLVLAGTRVDRVAQLSPSLDQREVADDLIVFQKMKDRMNMVGIIAWPAQVPSRNSMHDAFWRSIIHDCVRVVSPQTGMHTYRRAVASDYNDCLGHLEGFLARRNDVSSIVPLRIRDPFNVSINSSRMFITDAGRLGIGHMDCKVGDEVWILNGLRVPLILRPSGKFIADWCASDAAAVIETHEMIGEAYVHGLMYHEEHPDEIKALKPETVYLI